MKIHNSPGAYGILAGLLTLFLGLLANAGCVHEVRGRDAGIALESTVLITTTCFAPQGMYGAYGSGVIVGSHTILTAAHVVQDPPGARCMRIARMANGSEYLVVPHKAIPGFDLASLTSVEPFLPTYPIVYGPPPAFGERVCSMTAFPRYLWRCGEVQQHKKPPGDLAHTITTEGGNSGSGVYDMRGALVGIITHRWTCDNGQHCGGMLATLEGHVAELM